ncbi:MAG TPA: four helix bundle protein [Pyrinomonadaceae bacterium]|nr:four helix bundle protein [Pyrinomonadaceae bacterium]
MGKIERFEEFEAWQRSRELTKLIYQLSGSGDFGRDFGLKDQIRRAAVSIPSNIAEGFERDGDKEFVQFLSVAKGSCGEVRTQLYIALDQHYLTKSQFDSVSAQLIELSRMLSGLITYLRNSELRGRKFK